jgi:uncharacterized protein (TIGR00661 family)
MKIFYGIQGTGNGHITRARVMAKAFAQRPELQVDYFFSGRSADKYFDMECFGDFRTAKGLTFITDKGKVRPFKTFRNADLTTLIKDIRKMDLSEYDLVLNDFEPISAWAAKRQGITTINISHQSSMLHPMPFIENSKLAELGVRLFAPADIHLGVHWYHFGHKIIPPFIEVEPSDVVEDRKILVYLPFEDLDQVMALLNSYPEYSFTCYHPNTKYKETHGHIHLKPLSREDFPKDLANCEGVIANSGFELSSEALCLGKKLLLKPLAGQFEQKFNAQTLEKLGLASVMFALDEAATENWLEQSGHVPIKFPKNPDVLADWICSGDWQNLDTLCSKLWEQVEFPNQVLEKLKQMQITPKLVETSAAVNQVFSD